MSKQDSERFIRRSQWVFCILACLSAVGVMLTARNDVVSSYIFLFNALGFAAMTLVASLEYRRRKS